MSVYADVCEAWADDLTAHVAELSTATLHLYAPWSVENLVAGAGERHLAIWPEGEAETAEPMLVDGSQLATQSYVIVVWEDAAAETARRFDDDAANKAWLDLAEAIRARLKRQGAFQLGSADVMHTAYVGTTFPAAGALRVLIVGMRVRLPLAATP